ncbi:glycine/D-amino acid oxidase-like deaminating enzyme [Winogradskyella epiphytica]|uniref:Glycine/D-amino acid oxidase-like deaminating enzyme n=1 Tax=Winogradskyella epiphytica TaxID=262005 RepID=A0A2V4XMP9_9FLAO|nr:FAD-dependent oxidoreductase [Winogradskyella epiphytica]PYE83359.1 glycine/D-amino acid oxidase-like deaminating enzyme [Winogradskyella epiphytica]GGW57621.1 FAD-dependent oxidoreductase [Winogradskyella epiphytica]
MNLSYWEIKTWLTNIDFTIIGSGIVGLNCALELKKRYPKSKILILEKGILPQGASTKNAGFACFGSLSEIINDLSRHSEEEVMKLVKSRVDGLQMLRENLGDASIGYQNFGGYELFLESDEQLYESCLNKRNEINKLLHPIFNAEVFSFTKNKFGFEHIKINYCYNPFEGQIDTGKMMNALLNKVQSLGVKILNNTMVESFSENSNSVTIKTSHFNLNTNKLFIATNGFSRQFDVLDLKPARAQVLITKPIQDLQIKGTFHLDEGYYYFRNIDQRILLGGGRNLDFKSEETTEFKQTDLIQNKLEEILKTIILPHTNYEIDHRWSGIMGVGSQKKSIIKQLSNNVFCGVRLGGMGIAIGSSVGKDLANLLD